MGTDIDFALLCSAATFRDGLLSVLEAGLEVFQPTSLPAVIQPWLVFKVAFGDDGRDGPQLARAYVELQGSDAVEPERVADVGFSLIAPSASPDALSAFVMVIHPLPLQIRRSGVYTVNLVLNGELRRQLPFKVERLIPQV
ncbi:MAG: hypothetical protein QOK43_2366 [Acidimicrobiaceae bacterium]|nr:hypothetical protein [Acidimicrobiaceae bacterium]